MRGLVFCAAVTVLTFAGCTCTGEPAGVARCEIVSTTPGHGTTDVAVRPQLRIEWSAPVDPATLAGAVAIREIGGHEVPVAIVADGDHAVVVTPARSLWFDTVYALDVGAVAARDGGACGEVTTGFRTVVPAEVERPLRPASLEATARIGDYLVATSRSYRGLQVYDVSEPDQPVLVASVPTQVRPRGLAVSGDRAYVPAESDGVLILDVSRPDQPVVLGRAGTPGLARDVAPFERGATRYLAVADGVEGVRILDVTDPVRVGTVAVFDPSHARAADVRAVAIDGDVLAVADGVRGYAAVDLADPARPRLIGGGATGQTAIDVVLHRGLMYVSHFPGFVDVYDTRDPALPRRGGERVCNVCMQRFPAMLHLVGDDLFVNAAREGVRTYALDGAGGLTLTGHRPTPGPAYAVAATADRVFIGEEGGLLVFERAVVGPPRAFDPGGHGVASSIAIAGEHAYVAAASRGLQVFGIEEPEAPTLLGRVATPASPSGDISAGFVAAREATVFVGDVRGGLVTFDRATDPTTPALASQLIAHDGVQTIALRPDGLAVACQGNTGMLVADLSDPTQPSTIAEFFYPQLDPTINDYCLDVALDDTAGLAYVAGLRGLTILDLRDREQIQVAARLALPAGEALVSIVRTGQLLYAATRVPDLEGRGGQRNQLQVLDLTDPLAPVPMWTSPDLGAIGDLVLAGDILFAAASDLGVLAFDVSTPAAPALELAIPTTGDAAALAVTPDALYVAQSAGGIIAIHTGSLPVAVTAPRSARTRP